MKNLRSLFITAVCTCLFTTSAMALPIWSGSVNDNWSLGGVGNNWSGSAAPVAGSAPEFTNLDAAGTAGIVTNVVDTNFTINHLFYQNTGNNFHTTQIAGGQTLIVNGILRSGFAVQNTNASSVTIAGPGTLQFGSAGDPSSIEIGIGSGTSGAGHVTITGPVQTVNLDSISLGNTGLTTITGAGTLDLSAATIVGGTFSVNNDVRVGTGRGATGVLNFAPNATLDIGGSLYIGALTSGNNLADTTGVLNMPSSSTLIVGSGGSGNLYVGERNSTSVGDPEGTFIFSGNFQGNLASVRVAVSNSTQGSITGTLDLSGASFPGGVFAAQELEIGVGQHAIGTVTFDNTMTDLVIGRSFRLGAGSTSTDNVINNGFTEGFLNLADGTNITVGAVAPGDIRIGEKFSGGSGGTSSNGTFAPIGGTFTAHNLQEVYIGVNRSFAGASNGELDLSQTSLAGGLFSMAGNMDVGVGERADGTLNFGSSLTDLNIGGSLRVGAETFNNITVGNVILPTGVNMTIGTVTPGELVIGSRISTGGSGATVANGTVTLSSGTLSANLSEVRIGVNGSAASSNIDGVFDASTSTLVGAGFNVSGDIQIGIGRQTDGTLRLGQGLASAANVNVGDDTAGVNAGIGLLGLHGTRMTVSEVATIGLNGEVEVDVNGVSAGFNLTNSSNTALDIHASALGAYDITFLQGPAGTNLAPNALKADSIFYALRWEGDHEADLFSMLGSGLILWDDTTFLAPQFNGMVDIFYDVNTNATYIGFYTLVPEPSSGMLLLGMVGMIVRRRKGKRGNRGAEPVEC